MSEMKPTPGEWFCGDWIPADHNTAGWVEVWTVDAKGNRSLPFVSCKHFDAGDNARLIAEAGTVFHNTGLSPVQLVEMVKELKEALSRLLNADKDEHLTAQGVRNIARAALAKCEGVK